MKPDLERAQSADGLLYFNILNNIEHLLPIDEELISHIVSGILSCIYKLFIELSSKKRALVSLLISTKDFDLSFNTADFFINFAAE